MTEPTDSDRPALPYLVPMIGFVLLTGVEGSLPKGAVPVWYPLVYAVKVAVVSALAWSCRSAWRDLRPWPGVKALALAVGVGLLVTALWVGLDGFYPKLTFLGGRAAFKPSDLSPMARLGFITVRFFGLVVLIPLIEELFWRSFVIRWIIDQDFTKVPIGRVTLSAAAVTSVVFGLAHPEWLPGILTGFLWAGLLRHTRSVSACVVSHAVANLALGVYVVLKSAWKFW